ncbi:hypothetical protein TWF694_007142 [Orbilia ellipsospora]
MECTPNTANKCGNWLGYKQSCCALAVTDPDPTVGDIFIPCSYIPDIQTSTIDKIGYATYNMTGNSCGSDNIVNFFSDGTLSCCKTTELVMYIDPDNTGTQFIGCGNWKVTPSAQDIAVGEGKTTLSRGMQSTAGAPSPTTGAGASGSTPAGSSPTQTGSTNGGSTTSSGPSATKTNAVSKTSMNKVASLVLGSAVFALFLGAQL